MLPQFREQKALAAILYVAHKLIEKTKEKRADLYKLQKVLYFADKDHIAKYGRPITGDFYVAMKDGPVPSRTYDMLKQVRGDGYYCSDESFLKELKVSISFVENITILPIKRFKIENLAASNVGSIDCAIELLKNKTFGQIKNLSHDAAFDAADESNNIPMDSVAKAAGAGVGIIAYLNTWVENQTNLAA